MRAATLVLLAVLVCSALAAPLFAAGAQERADGERSAGTVELEVGDFVWIGPASGRLMHLFFADGIPAYCAEAMKDSPAAGTYLTRALDAPTGRNDLIRAILYYSPGAPGDGEVELPTWDAYANYGQTPLEMRKVDVHLMLAYAYGGSLDTTLPSFTFENWMSVRSWFCRNLLGVDDSGRVVNDQAPYQVISRKVDEVPEWFEVFEFAGSGSDQVIVSYLDTVSVTFNKTSADATISARNDEYSLSGAAYDIYDAGTDRVIASIVTDKDGRAALRLPMGSYYAIETAAPAGFAKNPERVEFQVSNDREAPQVALEDTPGTVRLYLTKVDSATGAAAQPGASLAGAEYQLTDANGAVHTARTDESGVVVFSNLPLGTSSVVETAAPEGYLLDTTVHRFTVRAGDLPASGVVELVPDEPFADDIIAFDIEIMKYLDTGDEGSGLQTPGVGIQFEIISNTTHEVIGTIETGAHGRAITDGKWFGAGERPEGVAGAIPYDAAGYTVREVPETVPDGYHAAPDWQITPAEMLDGATLHYIVDNDAIRSRIQVVKTDADTGQVVPLAGFTFQLLDAQKRPITQTAWYPNHAEQTEFTCDESGMVTFPEALLPGTYYIRETAAVAPYLLNGEDIEVVVPDGADAAPVVTVSVADERATGTATVVKRDGSGGALAGAEFDVVAQGDIVAPDGSVDAVAGSIVGHVVTDEDGRASIVGLPLGAGTATYAFVETVPPIGYVLDQTPREFTLTYADAHTEVVFAEVEAENAPTTVRIEKRVASLGTPLPAVTFEYWLDATDGAVPDDAQRVTTDEDGCAIIAHLAPGTYRIREVAAPAGYLVDRTVHTFAVDENGLIDGLPTYTLELENDYTKITVSKRDITNEKEVPGAELSILDSEGAVMASWTSTTEEHRIDMLQPGSYTLVETMTPNTYDEATSVAFTVEETGAVQRVVMYDEPIHITGELDKRQEVADPINPLAEADALASEGGTNRAPVRNSADGSYRYSIDFRNTSNTWVDEFTVTDTIDAAEQGLATLTGITTPVATGDYDGFLNIWYQTNLTPLDYIDQRGANATRSDGHENPWLDHESVVVVIGDDGRRLGYHGWKLWAEHVDAAEATDLSVDNLALADGEHVTAVRFEYGRVEEGFTTKAAGWDRDDLHDAHDDVADIEDTWDGEATRGAIMHLRVTSDYTAGTVLKNTATVDLYRNGGNIEHGQLEDHAGDTVEQTPRPVLSTLPKTGTVPTIPALSTMTAAGIIMLALIWHTMRSRRP